MIIHDFDVEGIALAKLKTDSPRPVHCHGPLTLTIAPKFVQPDALQRTKILKPLGDVQGQKQIHSGVKIQAADPVWLLAVPDLTACSIAP